jgi:hypothetical protein
MKAFAIAAAAGIALAPFSVAISTPGVAAAAPCAGAGSTPQRCQYCQFLVGAYHSTNRSCFDDAPQHAQATPTREPPPVQVPSYEPPITEPVQTPVARPPTPSTPALPTISPAGPHAPRNALALSAPKGLDASPEAIAAAKAAPAPRINPANPPVPPMQVYDFNHQVQNVIDNNSGNVEVVKVDNQTLVRPRHWDYIDYDDYHRPTLYNPLTEAMTFRYSYNGAYREAFVAAGARIVLDVATVGLFPFTAVGYSHLASGSFYGVGAPTTPGGWDSPPSPDNTAPAPPTVYPDVSAYIPAANQTMQVGHVMVVGHDGSQPAGSQDTFLLDDSTLAWGQINDSNSNAQIKVTKTQALPGVGPTNNGSFLVALAAHQEAAQTGPSWWPTALRYGLLVVTVGLVLWLVDRRRRSAESTASTQ